MEWQYPINKEYPFLNLIICVIQSRSKPNSISFKGIIVHGIYGVVYTLIQYFFALFSQMPKEDKEKNLIFQVQ